MKRIARTFAATWLILVVSLLSAGCGGGSNGPQIYKVSGTVEFDGKPVSKGFITFVPNTKKGNSGPGGGAEIKDGRFETANGKGVVGGAYIVQIRGSDGIPYSESGEDVPDGKELFPPYEFEVNFPRENSEQSFTIPKNRRHNVASRN